jgi:ADP-ribosylation factor GTPase-activating protein 2/3
MQQTIPDAERDAIFQKLKETPENNKCIDCDKKNPKWASVYLGLYICMDCSGKHREYGPQISFARSLNLDNWNERYITFMELGGNAKAQEYFKKQGLKAPYDYKSPLIQKYKQELTKKADALLANNNNTKEESSKPIFAAKFEEEKLQIKAHNDLIANTLQVKSFSDKPRHGEKESDDPFANNIIINKGETKTKGFTVEFSKNKSNFASNKGRIAAKKIDNVDLDALTLNEDGGSLSKKKFEMTESSFGASGQQNNVKEIFAKSNSATLKEQDEDKFTKFQNAKAISSDSFRSDIKVDSSQMKKFSGATAISSAQYFGEREEEPETIDYYQAAENMKDFFSTVGGKLKEKAEGIVTKIKDDWSS